MTRSSERDANQPPKNLEAERAALGSVLLDNDAWSTVAGILRVEDFYDDAHQAIYQTMMAMSLLGRSIDAINLAEDLIRRNIFERVGGDEKLSEIVHGVPHAGNARYYALIVREHSIARQLDDFAVVIRRDIRSGKYTAKDLINSIGRRLHEIETREAILPYPFDSHEELMREQSALLREIRDMLGRAAAGAPY